MPSFPDNHCNYPDSSSILPYCKNRIWNACWNIVLWTQFNWMPKHLLLPLSHPLCSNVFFFFVELFHIHTTWIDVLQIVDCFCFNRRHVRKASVHLLVAFDSFIQRELNREKWKGRINQLKRRHRSPCWCSIAGELISSKKYYARFIQHEIHVLFHFRYVRFDVKWTFI